MNSNILGGDLPAVNAPGHASASDNAKLGLTPKPPTTGLRPHQQQTKALADQGLKVPGGVAAIVRRQPSEAGLG